VCRFYWHNVVRTSERFLGNGGCDGGDGNFQDTIGKGVNTHPCEAGLLEGMHFSEVFLPAQKAANIVFVDFIAREFAGPAFDVRAGFIQEISCVGDGLFGELSKKFLRKRFALIFDAFQDGVSIRHGGLEFDIRWLQLAALQADDLVEAVADLFLFFADGYGLELPLAFPIAEKAAE
jgi:hypothetical protein